MIYSYCVPVSIMQSACTVFPSVTYLAVSYFSTLCHTRHDFFLKRLLNLEFVFSFYLKILTKTFLILRRTEGNMVINIYWSRKVPVILVTF
jgi:hypothetical protein